MVIALVAPNAGLAQAPAGPLTLALTPIEGHGPWRYEFALTSERDQQVTIDRRLLELTVRPEGSRRRLRCRHPDAPRRNAQAQPMTRNQVHREWIDLRMYCWGNALRALRAGNATIESKFGFARRGRNQFIAKAEGERRSPHRMDGPTIRWTAVAGSAPATAPIRVGLQDHTSRGAVRLRPTVRAGQGTRPHVYLRDDQFAFDIRGPKGPLRCERARLPIVPIRERFRRLGRRQVRAFLDPDYFCPDDAFAAPGVYEVTPTLTLPHGGGALGALTGVFVGSPGVIRVRRSSYWPQPLDSLPPRTTEEGDE